MALSEQLEHRLAEYTLVPDSDIPLLQATLTIGLVSGLEIDFDEEQRHFNAMAEGARERMEGVEKPQIAFQKLLDFFFRDLGFNGDSEDYYNPENSLMHVVLEKAKGIPITLSILFIELARAVGFDVFGVGFPGHFLIGARLVEKHRPEVTYHDPFQQGHSLSSYELQEMLDAIYGHHVHLTEMHLRPVTNRYMLTRVLNNLKMAYSRNHHNEETLRVLDALLLLDPSDLRNIRDRGLINAHLGHYQQALVDLEKYVEADTTNRDRQIVVRHLTMVRRILGIKM